MKDELDTKKVEQVQQALVGLSPEQFAQILERVGQTNAKAMRQAIRRENPDYNEKSVFQYPEGATGKEKPKLNRATFFCGIRQREDSLTPGEIDLFNRFTSDKSAHSGQWTARVGMHGTVDSLKIDVPAKSLDDRMSLPNGLGLILRELLDGEDAVNADRLNERVAELEAVIKELTSTSTKQPVKV